MKDTSPGTLAINAISPAIMSQGGGVVVAIVAALIRRERAACARIARGYVFVGKKIAADILARNKPPKGRK